MVTDNQSQIPTTVNASPTKSFFVEMLTRDIELEDAIIDLLDNCVDGIQRITKAEHDSDKPYQKFWAKLSLSSDSFTIEDNCGGIPIDIAKGYAFRMGRPHTDIDIDNDLYTIGTYGIGMKRAIFKMGRSCEVISQTENESFKVTINSEWIANDTSWQLPCETIEPSLQENGTLIKVGNLYPTIVEAFSSQTSPLLNSLVNRISQHYTYIIHKGFTVYVNNHQVSPKPLKLLWQEIDSIDQDKPRIAPYLYELQKDGVDVRLAIGFYRSTASEEEVDEEMEGTRRSSEEAGWTIVCNDRVVLYCDKTRLTGWGEEKVPSYHPQFIAISGIVHFRSKDSRKLPITTTKRGIDASSDIYLYVKDFMRDGLKTFTSYTNKWKGNLLEEKTKSEQSERVDPNKLFEEITSELWTPVKNKNNEKRYIPPLPIPEAQNGRTRKKRIIFSRMPEEIKAVSEYLFEDSEREPSEVGNECFEKVLREAKEQ